MSVDPFARRRIVAITEAALQSAGVAGVLPTPLDAISEIAGVTEILPINDLPSDLQISRPNVLRRILGAYVYRTDTAFVDLSQPTGRRRFILAHETSHRLLPWHEDSHRLDDEQRLFRETDEELEEEANLAAALLIFQGNRFLTRALDYENALETPIALSDTYGASMASTIRYYASHHPEPIGLLVAGRYPRANGTLPIYASTQSRPFLERFGDLARYFPEAGLPAGPQDEHPAGSLVHDAMRISDVQTTSVRLRDLRGEYVDCRLQAFYNQYSVFVLATPMRRLRRGRRLQLEVS